MKLSSLLMAATLFPGALVASCATAQTAPAATIIDDWKSVQVPPPPALQPVSVVPAKTALLVLDMSVDTCSEARRPACAKTLPGLVAFLHKAREHGLLVIHSTGPAAATTPLPAAAPGLDRLPGEPVVRAYPDKFLNSDLEKILADHKIDTVIVTGTSSQGAVLYTATEAAMRRLNVVVPVDAYSSESRFADLYTAWHLKNATATIAAKVTLTRLDLVDVK
jgi:nicotinamidase-related amidase